jgi:hypothetical protein
MQQFDMAQGTIFANWLWRALGAKIGKGALLLGSMPGEMDILTIGELVIAWVVFVQFTSKPSHQQELHHAGLLTNVLSM